MNQEKQDKPASEKAPNSKKPSGCDQDRCQTGQGRGLGRGGGVGRRDGTGGGKGRGGGGKGGRRSR